MTVNEAPNVVEYLRDILDFIKNGRRGHLFNK
jgi:hypothetical protein